MDFIKLFPIIALAARISASAATVVATVPDAEPIQSAGYDVVVLDGREALSAYHARTGARLSLFPALVDEDVGAWVRIEDGDVAAASAALAELVAWHASVVFDAAVVAKSPDQLALEAEYFEAADALHVLAGEAAPTNDEPASLSAVKAKVKKAKGTKGGSKKADDYLEIQASHVDLLTLDLELRAYDPDWRAKAKRPKE